MFYHPFPLYKTQIPSVGVPLGCFSALLPGDAQGWRGKVSCNASPEQGKGSLCTGKSDGNGEGRCETAREAVRLGMPSQGSVVD